VDLGRAGREVGGTASSAADGTPSATAKPSGAPAKSSAAAAKPSAGEAPGPDASWDVPVLTTNALTGEGLPEVIEALDAHRAWIESSGELALRRRARTRARIHDVVDREIRRVAWGSVPVRERVEAGLDRIDAGEGTPYSVAREILGLLLR